MDKYYYLIAQLPVLNFNEKKHIDIKYFMTQAEEWLSPYDFIILKKANINDIYLKESDKGILKSYKIFEYSLRDSIVKFREGNIEAVLDSSLKDILTDVDPLKVELGLLRFRWNFIEELESCHNFDLEIIVLYLYKLQILDRIAQFDIEKGKKLFDKISNIKYEEMVYEKK